MTFVVYDKTAQALAGSGEYPDVDAARHACSGHVNDDGRQVGFEAEDDPRHEFVILDLAAGVPA